MNTNIGDFLAVINMVIAGLAGLGYLLAGDFRHSLYWLAACVLTATVTL